MDEIRRAGARIQLITDGDVNPIVNAGIEGTGVHMYIGKKIPRQRADLRGGAGGA